MTTCPRRPPGLLCNPRSHPGGGGSGSAPRLPHENCAAVKSTRSGGLSLCRTARVRFPVPQPTSTTVSSPPTPSSSRPREIFRARVSSSSQPSQLSAMPGSSDLVPFWVYEEGSSRVERRVPRIPFSREVGQLDRLKRSLALYRLVFGQPRQEDLLAHISENVDLSAAEQTTTSWRISLQPPQDSEPSD